MDTTSKLMKFSDYMLKLLLVLYLLNIPQKAGVPVFISFIVMVWLIVFQLYKCCMNHKQKLSNTFDIPFTVIIIAASIVFIVIELQSLYL